MSIFVSLAVSATMFPERGQIVMRETNADDIRAYLADAGADVISALNPSHASTLEVIRRKFDLALPIPERAPKVVLVPGDSLIIIQANLPRLAEGERHSDETVAGAPISFRLWNVF